MPSRPVSAPTSSSGLPGALRDRAREVLDAGDADAHGVHERVARVRLLEADLAADGRDAEAVAVAADARDDATEEVAVARVIERAEAERVQDRDRPRAHREDVAHDAADARRGALVRLDGRGVIVRLDLERDAPAVADVDDAGVLLADLGEQARPLGGKEAQERLAVLVATVLAPEGAQHAQLDLVRLAVEALAGEAVLLPRERDLVEDALVDGHVGLRAA
jgi:hypothetical protein